MAVLDLYDGIDSVKELCFTDCFDEIKRVYSVSEKVPDIIKPSDIELYIGKNILECCKTADIVFLHCTEI